MTYIYYAYPTVSIMMPSSMPGKVPLSSRLQEWLAEDEQEGMLLIEDELDLLIQQEGLQISRFVFFRDLDLMLIVLTNRRIISQPLSSYPFLASALDEQLNQYEVSVTGLHWPVTDADLSLRGFLMNEMRQQFRTPQSFWQAA